jgi:hypothetical protein
MVDRLHTPEEWGPFRRKNDSSEDVYGGIVTTKNIMYGNAM